MDKPSNDLTTNEFAQLINRPRNTVCWWLRTGRIPGAYKRGPHWRVPTEHAHPPAPRQREPTYPPLD